MAGVKGFAGPLMSATCTAIALVQPVSPQAARVRAAVARRVHLMQAPSRPLTAWCKRAVLVTTARLLPAECLMLSAIALGVLLCG